MGMFEFSTRADADVFGDGGSVAKKFAVTLIYQLEKWNVMDHVDHVDHICYRTATVKEYETLRKILNAKESLLTESCVNGRPIAVFNLREPIVVDGRFIIDTFELPAPKIGKHYKSGFEHIEVVVKGPLEDLRERLCDKQLKMEWGGSDENRELVVATHGGVIKFHEQRLDQVIALEKAALVGRDKGIVLFDFDETLISGRTAFIETVKVALQNILGRRVGLVELKTKSKPSFPDFLKEFDLTTEGDIGSFIDAFVSYWPEVQGQVMIPDGVVSLLSCLKHDGYELAVWTARDGQTTESCLRALGLRDHFSEIFSFSLASGTKPTLCPRLAKHRGSRPVVMIGDSVTDQKAAETLGCRFIQASWVQKNNLSGSDFIALNPHEVLKHLP
jgi:uncharacterized protein